ncbi:sirohydrochlorin cobaltochelatase, partial [Desulfotalea psychrophila]|nr:sirohydrochlorin cobaltochelatase [Desulfotalea psychrophila]
KMHQGVVTVVGNVEGYPAIEDVIETLHLYGIKKVVLKPFMVVAGDHTLNDMASDEEDSWKSILTKNGFEVICIPKGLGENKKFANIFVSNIGDAAKDAGIKLQ